MATSNWHYTPEWPHWETMIAGHINVIVVSAHDTIRDPGTLLSCIVKYSTSHDGPSNSQLGFWF